MARPTAPAPATTNYPVIRGPKAVKAVEDYVAKTAAIKVLEDEVRVIRDFLLGAMDSAPVVFVGARTVTRTDVPEQPTIPARKITREMIGQEIPGKPGRRGYAQVRVQ